jgi:hypothetical protein
VISFVNTLVLSHLNNQEVTFLDCLLERLVDSLEMCGFSGLDL